MRLLVFEEFVNLGREVHNTVELLSFGYQQYKLVQKSSFSSMAVPVFGTANNNSSLFHSLIHKANSNRYNYYPVQRCASRAFRLVGIYIPSTYCNRQ